MAWCTAASGSFHSGTIYFEWPEFKKSYVAGSFSDWKPLELTEKSTRGYGISKQLPIGVHQYLFLVDGKWRMDPTNHKPLINGRNQVEVLPNLPPHIPSALKGYSTGHLYLSFPSSFMKEIVQFVHNCGLRKFLISVIVLASNPDQSPDRVSACALLKQSKDNDREETQALQYINDSISDKSKVMVFRFQKNPSFVSDESKFISPQERNVIITSALPDYVVEQHVREHFGYFSEHIKRVRKCDIDQNFHILFDLAENASEAVSAYHNSIFQGVTIQVSLTEITSADYVAEGKSDLASDSLAHYSNKPVSTIDLRADSGQFPIDGKWQTISKPLSNLLYKITSIASCS